MSWAEDNGIDMGYDIPNPEEDWVDGIHIDQNGKEHKIMYMTDSHLLNTIKFFKIKEKDNNLILEAKKRKLI